MMNYPECLQFQVLHLGPVGLNVATFAGFKTVGITGSIDATLAIMIPSFIIVVFISKILKKFKDNFYTKGCFVCASPGSSCDDCSGWCKAFLKQVYLLADLI